MKRLVIVGASGMVGGYALRYALEHPKVERVTSVGRRNLGISHPKLTEVLHPNFADCSALAKTLSGQDAAVFCLGTYTGAGERENLVLENRDILAMVNSAQTHHPA
jgi:N-acetyl-gamma-glutamylphosphate reductase